MHDCNHFFPCVIVKMCVRLRYLHHICFVCPNRFMTIDLDLCIKIVCCIVPVGVKDDRRPMHLYCCHSIDQLSFYRLLSADDALQVFARVFFSSWTLCARGTLSALSIRTQATLTKHHGYSHVYVLTQATSIHTN